MRRTEIKKNVIKVVALVLMLISCLSVLSACSSGYYGDYSINTKTVMKVGKYKISYDEYKAFYNGAMTELAQTENITDFTDERVQARVKEIAEAKIRQRYVVRLLADKYDIKLTKENKHYIEDVIAECEEGCGGTEKYRQWLSESMLTGTVFRKSVEIIYGYDVLLRELLFTGYENVIPVDHRTVKNDVLEKFYHYQVIYLSFDEGDNLINNIMLMDEAYERLAAGADFLTVAKEYQKYSAVVYSPEGYTTEGEKEFFDVLKGLEIGEYCERVFESDDLDLAIVKRLALDENYIELHIDELTVISATRRYNEYIKNEAKDVKVTYTSYFDTITHDMLTEKIDTSLIK